MLLPTPPDAAQPSFDPERSVQNQVELMTSAAVLGEAARRHGGGPTVDAVRERVGVDASQSSDVIAVRALGRDPTGAAKLADSLALAYEDVLAQRRKWEAEGAIPAVHAQQARLRSSSGPSAPTPATPPLEQANTDPTNEELAGDADPGRAGPDDAQVGPAPPSLGGSFASNSTLTLPPARRPGKLSSMREEKFRTLDPEVPARARTSLERALLHRSGGAA